MMSFLLLTVPWVSSSWHCAVHCHPVLHVRSGPETECSLPASYFPRTYVLSNCMWAFRRAILGSSIKISAGCCKAMNSGDLPPSVIVPAGAGIFICTTGGWCDLRQRGRWYLCRNRSCWSGRLQLIVLWLHRWETTFCKHQQSDREQWNFLQGLSDIQMQSAEIKLTKLGKMEGKILNNAWYVMRRRWHRQTVLKQTLAPRTGQLVLTYL